MTVETSRILVIGSTGMLGQALVREGRRRNYTMTGIARSNADLCADITDTAVINEILKRIRPHVIINAAAITSLPACQKDPCTSYAVNARPAANLANFCKQENCYLVQISTDHYFTGDGAAKHDESAPVMLLNEYAASKYAGEAFALTYPEALVVRTNIVGFRNRGTSTFVEWAIQSLKNHDRLILFDDFFTSSIHVGGFAEALFDLLPIRPSGVLNLAARDVCSKKEFIQMLADALSLPLVNSETGSVTSLADARRAESLGLDVSKAEKLLQYSLPTTRQAVIAIADEYREGKE